MKCRIVDCLRKVYQLSFSLCFLPVGAYLQCLLPLAACCKIVMNAVMNGISGKRLRGIKFLIHETEMSKTLGPYLLVI